MTKPRDITKRLRESREQKGDQAKQMQEQLTIIDAVIDEYDEGNNANYLVVTGASLDAPGTVPSFAPSLLLIVLVGFGLSLLQRKTRD